MTITEQVPGTFRLCFGGGGELGRLKQLDMKLKKLKQFGHDWSQVSVTPYINPSQAPVSCSQLLKATGIRYSEFIVSVLTQYNSIQTQDATIYFNVTLNKIT